MIIDFKTLGFKTFKFIIAEGCSNFQNGTEFINTAKFFRAESQIFYLQAGGEIMNIEHSLSPILICQLKDGLFIFERFTGTHGAPRWFIAFYVCFRYK